MSASVSSPSAPALPRVLGPIRPRPRWLELRLLALTAPRGNRFFIWNLDSTELLLDAPLPDCAGVGAVADGFVVTSGQGRCRLYDCRGEQIAVRPLELPAGLWDNHLRLA